jgi:serine protease Do
MPRSYLPVLSIPSRLAPLTRAGAAALAVMMAVPLLGAQTVRAAGPTSVAPVAEKLIDAVVNISTSQTIKGAEGVPLPRVPKGSPFEEFFDDFFNKKGSSDDRKASSLGSGFVIDAKEGIIVTNNHVIDGADEITANFADGTKLKAELIGKDPKADLAVLRVKPGKKPLAAVPFGSSTKIKTGDWVMAIGNPFGLGGSVTLGIISAKQRDINSGPYDEFLQTDAAINKGNSGGPLFNMDGEVIGINTAIISPSGGSIGIGFAVPSDSAVVVIDQLRKYGEARRGWLGVKIRSVSDDMAETLGLKETTGALIESVTANGPAAKGGMQDGDVILKFDGREIANVRALTRAVAQTPVEKSVGVDILRKGKAQTLQIAVGRLIEEEKPSKDAKKSNDDKGDKSDKDKGDKKSDVKPLLDQTLLGLKLAPLDDALRSKFTIDAKVKGVVVLEVDPQSPAAQKGVRAGDVIVEAAQDPVSAVADVGASIDKVKKAGRRAILLRLEDGKGDLRFVAIPLS